MRGAHAILSKVGSTRERRRLVPRSVSDSDGAGFGVSVQRAFAGGIAGEIPPDQALPELWLVDEARWAEARALLQGRVLDAPRGAPGVSARVYGPNGFLGLGYWQDDGRFAPRRLIATAAESTTAIA